MRTAMQPWANPINLTKDWEEAEARSEAIVRFVSTLFLCVRSPPLSQPTLTQCRSDSITLCPSSKDHNEHVQNFVTFFELCEMCEMCKGTKFCICMQIINIRIMFLMVQNYTQLYTHYIRNYQLLAVVLLSNQAKVLEHSNLHHLIPGYGHLKRTQSLQGQPVLFSLQEHTTASYFTTYGHLKINLKVYKVSIYLVLKRVK